MNPLDWLQNSRPHTAHIDVHTAAWSVAVTFVLSVVIAWLHRKAYRGTAYSQDYAHTLIIIAVVTTVLITVVSKSGAIGVGMFAAFSILRFPRNLGQSSDLAFGFFSIAVGMVSGTGRWGTAAFITMLVGGAVLFLIHRNAFAPLRATHMLRLSLASDADFENILAPVFAEHTEETHLMRLVPSLDGDRTELRYGLQLKSGINTARFIEALHHACGNHRIVLEPTNHEFDD